MKVKVHPYAFFFASQVIVGKVRDRILNAPKRELQGFWGRHNNDVWSATVLAAAV